MLFTGPATDLFFPSVLDYFPETPEAAPKAKGAALVCFMMNVFQHL